MTTNTSSTLPLSTLSEPKPSIVARTVAAMWIALARAHHHGWAAHTDVYTFVETAERQGLDAAIAYARESIAAAEAREAEEGVEEPYLGLRPERVHTTSSGRCAWTVEDDRVYVTIHRPAGPAFEVTLTPEPETASSIEHGCHVSAFVRTWREVPMADRHLAYVIEVMSRLTGIVSSRVVADVIGAALKHTTER